MSAYALDDWALIPGKYKYFYHYRSRSTVKSTQPDIKGPEREADLSPPSSGDVKMRGALPPFLHTSLYNGA
jgi:hypothetical protein